MNTTTTALQSDAIMANALREDEFLRHMTGMQTHYSPGGNGMKPLPQPYELPAPVLRLALKAPLASITAAPVKTAADAAIASVLRAGEQDALDFVHSHQSGIITALTATKVAADTARFVQQMQALEQQELADHAARIKRLFDGLIATGQAHPGHQPHSLMAANGVGGFLAGLLNDAHTLSHGIVGTVSGVAHALASGVQEAGKAVGNWVSGAVHSVGSFFSSLF